MSPELADAPHQLSDHSSLLYSPSDSVNVDANKSIVLSYMTQRICVSMILNSEHFRNS